MLPFALSAKACATAKDGTRLILFVVCTDSPRGVTHSDTPTEGDELDQHHPRGKAFGQLRRCVRSAFMQCCTHFAKRWHTEVSLIVHSQSTPVHGWCCFSRR